jgi:DNA-binding beta-propeller fold protein YncE
MMNSSTIATGFCEDFGYEADDHWAKLPPGWSWQEVVGVVTDRHDRVYVFNRGEHPVIIFERDGTFIGSWGEGLFVRPHGIFIGPDECVYCIDDLGHTVRKFTPEGRLLLTLGSGQPSDTGATSLDFRTIVRAGPPFHYPTNLALSPEGDLYVSDGYGNARIHKFTPEGRLLFSWGEPGIGPGQFHIPHGIAVDRHGTVYVADRENSRIQRFNSDGKYLSEWTDVARPCEVFIGDDGEVYVAELGFRAGMWPGTDAPANAPGGRVSIFDAHGTLLARWGGGRNPCAPGDFFAPHDIWVDAHGDLYVSEVVYSGGGNRGLVSADCHALQKFVRRRPER